MSKIFKGKALLIELSIPLETEGWKSTSITHDRLRKNYKANLYDIEF